MLGGSGTEGTLGQAAIPEHEASAPSHTAFRRIVHRGVPLAVRALHTRADFGSSGAYMAETFGQTPGILCAFQLHDYPAAHGWRDERHHPVPRLPAGSTLILDLRHAWRTDVIAAFDNVHINVTQAALDAVSEERRTAQELDLPPFAVRHDETLQHLALSLLPALGRPREASALFADHVAMAAAHHLAHAYGSRRPPVGRTVGGLAAWQAVRARELMLDRLDGDIGLADLAAACGLSPSHFAKAFKRSFGLPPHRWLVRERVSRAREMLLFGDEPVGRIAAACGFADQSHLNRVFARAEGLPPGAWRRMRRA